MHPLILGALLAVVLWAGNFVAIKLALHWVDPIFLTALRFGLVALLLPFVGWPHTIGHRVLLGYALASCLGQYLLSTMAIWLGLSAGITALVMQAQVFISIGLARWFLHERLRTTTLVGTLLAFIGLACVLVTGRAHVTVAGFVVCLIAAASWAAAGLMLRSHQEVVDVFQLQTASAALAFPVTLACSFLLETRHYDTALIRAEPIGFVAALFYSTWVSFALAQTLWGRAIQGLGLSIVSPLSMLVPVVGVTLAYLALGERYTLGLMASVALVLVGLAVHFVPIVRAGADDALLDARPAGRAPPS